MFKETTDDELMVRAATGDSAAFRGLFDRHGSRLLGYCRRFMGNSTRGEDMAQDVWMKVIRMAPSYRGEGKFRAWLLSVARNTCLSEMRRNSEIHTADVTDLGSDVQFNQQIDDRENLELVKREIEVLPAAQRAVLTMLVAEDLSYEQIASELELSVAAVKSLLFRARQSLHKAMRTGT